MKDVLDKLLQKNEEVQTGLHLKLQLGSIKKVPTAADRPKTAPVTEDPHLYGRDDEMNRILDDITHKFRDQKGLTIIPIVGPGGIGKTTFAQHLYEKAKSSFEATIWICVSSSYDVNNLIQQLKGKIPEVQGENRNTSDEELIQQRLKSSRFFIVFDDTWECKEDDWKRLLAPLRKGEATGNMVLITTRFPDLATKLGIAKDLIIELNGLAKEPFEKYFQACVFGQEKLKKEECSLFEDIGRKIMDKLKGSPLAAKTVGRLLRGQEEEHWTKVLENKDWERLEGDNNIMPILKLSYDFLPLHLQQCFTYCVLFPEDYTFQREELIHLWTGLELPKTNAHDRITEDKLISYLNELVMRGFFDAVPAGIGDFFVIHDLLRELALKIPSNECLSICYPNVRAEEIHPSVRHLSIILKDDDKDSRIVEKFITELKREKEKLQVKNLRTLMIFDDKGLLEHSFGDLFKELNSLRVFLVHSSMTVSVTHMLENLSKFIHLRYLKLVSFMIHRPIEVPVPSTVSRFYHLRTLDLREWSTSLINLSNDDISNLVNLHYFKINRFRHRDTEISRVGKLKFLRELMFSVRWRQEGFDLKELEPLVDINRLGIFNLENVGMEEAGDAKLGHKNNLHELTLLWGDRGTSAADPSVETLESFRPHSSLKKLHIIGHSGYTCPTWLDPDQNLSVPGLQTLDLHGVKWKDLRPLEKLNLRSLKVEDSNILLLPPIPWTHTLCNVDISSEGSIRNLYYSKNQLGLSIKGSGGVVLDETVLAFHNLTGIESLDIQKCLPLGEQHLQKLTSLKYLQLTEMNDVLLPSPNGGSDVKSQLPVQWLKLERCSVGGKNLTRLLYYFPALSELLIESCKTITRIDVLVAGQEEATTRTTTPSALATRLEDARLQQNQLQKRNQEDEEIIEAEQQEELLVLPSHIFSSLEKLYIMSCSDLILVQQGEGLHRSLARLSIVQWPKSFASWATSWEQNENIHPCKLQDLQTDNSARLFTTPVCNLFSSSLTELTLWDSKVVTFTEGQENAFQLLTSLKKLEFILCSRLEVLPRCLDKLSKLEKICIDNCNRLRWPDDQSPPSSLRVLDVQDCDKKLKEDCRKLIGIVPQVILGGTPFREGCCFFGQKMNYCQYNIDVENDINFRRVDELDEDEYEEDIEEAPLSDEEMEQAPKRMRESGGGSYRSEDLGSDDDDDDDSDLGSDDDDDESPPRKQQAVPHCRKTVVFDSDDDE